MGFDPGERALPVWLLPLTGPAAALFGTTVRLRRAAYEHGLVKSEKAAVPVISVGNIAVGGTGKTPFVVWLASRLAPRKVAILSRGYGRRSDEAPVIVSRGGGPLVSVEVAGDEPFLMAQKTEAMVIVDRDRVRASKKAAELGAEVILLDDGFQHLRLARDLEIVLLDAERPFGNGAMLPRGPLRDHPAAVSRADLIVLVGGGQAATNGASFKPEIPRMEMAVTPTAVEGAQGMEPASSLRGKRVALLSAIARPSRFAATVRMLGAEVVLHEARRDHAWIDAAEVRDFVERASSLGAEILLTTEKDAVRLPHEPALARLLIEQRVVSGEGALAELLAAALPGYEGGR